MNNLEARELLLLYRPGVDDPDHPEFAGALELVKSDPELLAWFQRHCALQNAIAAGFDGIAVPPGLKEQILSERYARLGLTPRRQAALLAMCALLILSMVLVINFRPGARQDNSFSNYRNQMAGKILREYPRMDLETNDLQAIRQYLARNQGSSDYALPPALEKTSGTGCAIFPWHGQRVSMICFYSGKGAKSPSPDLFLFIVDRTSVQNPPAGSLPELAAVNHLPMASWSKGDKTYLLTGSGDEAFLRQYY